MMTTRVTGKVEEIFSYARPEEVETRDRSRSKGRSESREETTRQRSETRQKRNKGREAKVGKAQAREER
jgi:hypothetical protein